MQLTEKHLAVTAPGLRSPDPSVRRGAFAELVKAHLPQQVSFLRASNPTLHAHVLEEIVEDTFNLVWREVESGDTKWIETWTWSYFQGATKNKGKDAFRKFARAKKRFGEHQRDEPVSHEKDVEIYGDVRPAIHDRDLRSEHLQILEKTIAALPEQQRRIAVLLQQNPESRLSRSELSPGLICSPPASSSSTSRRNSRLSPCRATTTTTPKISSAARWRR